MHNSTCDEGAGDIATGLFLAPPSLTAWPLALFPTIMVPFFAVLHLVAVLQSRHHWEDRVGAYAIRGPAGADGGSPWGSRLGAPRGLQGVFRVDRAP